MFFHFDTKELTLNDARSSRISMNLSSELGRLTIRIDSRDTSCSINITSDEDLKRLRDFIDNHLNAIPQKTYPEKGMGVTLFDANGRIDTQNKVELTDYEPKHYNYEQLHGLFQQNGVYALYKLYDGISDDKAREVVGYCIQEQIKFVLTGDPSFSKKMTLKDVSDALGYDIALVSRCTKDACIYSPCGKVFTLDNNSCTLTTPSLFDDGISWNGKDVSRLEVLDMIQRMVEKEDKDKPLGDDELAVRLQQMGYDIQRRTVAKYRGDFLGLPNSNERRRGLTTKNVLQ